MLKKLLILIPILFISCNGIDFDIITYEKRFNIYELYNRGNSDINAMTNFLPKWEERYPKSEYIWIQTSWSRIIILPKEDLRRLLDEE